MVTVISGSFHSDKTLRLVNSIKKSLLAEKQVYVIVPDQFIYEYDKILYKELGVRLFNKIPVVSFNKLAKIILNEYGSAKGEFQDDNTKQIMMYKTLKKVKATSDFYKKQFDKPEFVTSTLELIKELRQSCVNPEELKNVNENISGMLHGKLSDIADIYQNYCDTLTQYGYKDVNTALNEAAETALENGHFNGFDVFVDEFNSFTNDELQLIRYMIKQADNFSISLTYPQENSKASRMSPFVNVKATENSVVNMAGENNKKVSFVKCDNNSQKSDISYISENLFLTNSKKKIDTENIKIISADDIYDEAEYVCAKIKHLICDDNYKYRDIAVISRNINDYDNVFSSTFEKYDIPYYIDSRHNVSSKSLILYVYNIFDCVTTKKYNTEAILKFVKSSLNLLGSLKVSQLEEYCYKWNVKGDMWLTDFTASDSLQDDDENDKYLDKINKIRKQIIDNFESFKNATVNTDATHICMAFIDLLNNLKLAVAVSESLKNAQESYGNTSDVVEISRDFKQLWKVLTGAIKSIDDNIGKDKITLKEFYKILKLMLSQSSVSLPPQKLDSVVLASADRSKLADVKVAFIVGVNEGIMPAFIKDIGLLNERDKSILSKEGVNISKSALWRISHERFITYTSFSIPTEKLYISFSQSDLSGGARHPSFVVRQLLEDYKTIEYINTSCMPSSFYFVTKKAMFTKYVENLNSKDNDINTARKLLSEDDIYNQKLEFIENFSTDTNHRLSKDMCDRLLVKKDLYVSATKLENYSRCPYSYFCRYGLGLSPVRVAEISPVNKGTVVHYCLEKIMSKEIKNGKKVYNKSFEKLSEEELKEKIKVCLDIFMKDELGGDFGKTNRFKYVYSGLVDIVYEVLSILQKQFLNSDYKPHDFELNLISGKESILKISLDNGLTINISGKIDRVDTFEKDGKKYLRIIDYKTSPKELDFEDIYNGINLQMILYLSALIKGHSDYTDYIPSGVLYMPATDIDESLDRALLNDEDKLEVKIDTAKFNNFKMNGIVVDLQDSLDAMQKEFNGKFIKYRKDKSNLLDTKQFERLSDFVNKKIKEIANGISEGKIDAIPVGNDKYLPCDRCDYWNICGNFKTEKAKIISKDDAIKMMSEIDGVKKDKAGECNE